MFIYTRGIFRENTCVPIDTAISGLCGTDAAKASEIVCKGIKSGEIELCSFMQELRKDVTHYQ